MVDLPCSSVTRLMSAMALLLVLGVQTAPAATATVDFDQIVALQSMVWGTNEVEGQLRPSAVAPARLQEINSRCIRYWLDGHVRPDSSTWDWPRLDEGVDKIVASGATPMICFAGIPDWMAISPNPGKPNTWNHPRDLNEWAAYCIAIVGHCANRRYPIDEWYWEIWNEPNNGGVSGGWSVADYLALYDAAASALRQAFPTIRIGGPSTDHASENWIVPLLQGHDVQFITWHRYGAWDPTLAKSSESYLSETGIYGTEAAKVKNWIETRRPGEGILNVCGEINLNAYCCPIDSRIWEPMLIPWYTSVMRHLLLSGCDMEQFFVGTDKSWPNYGLFLGTGGYAGLRSPAFFAKQLFTTAAPPGSELTACQVSGSSTLEALAVRTPLGRRHVILINKTTAQTPVSLSITGAEVAGGIWYTVDADSYAAGGITAHVSAGGSPQSTTLVGYATTVLAICEPGETCDPDRDGDGLFNLFDNCPDTASSNPFDSDFDGVGDACDLCPDTPRGEPVNSTGCRHVRSDFDRDLDVDMEDFGHLQACLTGPGIAQPALACRSARLDDDTDVDDNDVTVFLRCLSGPGVPANPVCE